MRSFERNNIPEIVNVFQDYDLNSDKENISNISSIKFNNSFFEIQNPLINKLIEFGYKSKISKRLIYILHPANIEQAIDYLSEENGIIQHYFYQNLYKMINVLYVEKEENNI